jgi:von Willebrand factor type A domain
MRLLRTMLGKRAPRRAYGLAATALLTIGFGPTLASATAATPAHTDVMLLFDTSGSMGSQLTEAKNEIQEVIAHVSATLPDAQFGVAEVRDFASSEEVVTFEKPWKLDQAITADSSAVKAAIEPLSANGGGDFPESYGRALWETDTNPNVGWRAGARHVIILVADNVPHDNNLDEGIPESSWASEGTPAPWNTGEEKPGPWGIPGTLMTPAVDRNFQHTLEELNADGKPIGMVDFSGAHGYLPYWEHWAAATGGQALEAGSGELATKVTTLITTGATSTLPACAAGQVRDASGVCVVQHPSVTQVICNLIIATATDTCTATVADAAGAGATNPTGTVSFTSTNGGVFIAGNTCALVSTPLSPNVSSCSVQFLPPSTPGTLPEIKASYGGDSLRAASSGETHYGPASSLSSSVNLSGTGTINGPNAEVPVECLFPCETSGELFNEPGLANLASFGSPSVTSVVFAESAAHSKKKKKKKKPVLLGKGKLKLSTPGKGKLVIKLSHKARKALSQVSSKGVSVTLKFTVHTLNGTVVTTKSQHIKLRPKAKKAKKKHH